MEIILYNERAERVIAFIEKLRVPSGQGAGECFVLEDFEKKFIYDIYSPHVFDIKYNEWKRVVRNAILSMARKNGKTMLIACLVLVHLVGPEAEINNEIYSAANDKEQAAQVFKYCQQIITATKEIQPYLTVVPSTKTIACFYNGSNYKAISRESKTKHGQNPGLVIYDELAQSPDVELYETLDSSMGARKEPLMIVISTQSKDPQHILSQLIDDGIKSDDPTVICHLYALPDDWEKQGINIYDESIWHLANPALNKFLYPEYIRAKAGRASRMPSFENSFMNLHLNMRVDSTPSLISRAEWLNCYDAECKLEEGEDIYLGLDLSGKIDLSALVAISANDGDRLAAWFWKPKDTLDEHEKRDRVPYNKWVKEGFIEVCNGKSIDYQSIGVRLLKLKEKFNIIGMAFDPWRIDQLIKELENLDIGTYQGEYDPGNSGIRLVGWIQGFKTMTPAIEEFEIAVIEGKLKHDGNPVLTWNFSNAVAISDPSNNRKLDKQKSRFRIDGAVSAVMAKGLKAVDMSDDIGNLDDFIFNTVTLEE